jgi:hypothetical protein
MPRVDEPAHPYYKAWDHSLKQIVEEYEAGSITPILERRT